MVEESAVERDVGESSILLSTLNLFISVPETERDGLVFGADIPRMPWLTVPTAMGDRAGTVLSYGTDRSLRS